MDTLFFRGHKIKSEASPKFPGLVLYKFPEEISQNNYVIPCVQKSTSLLVALGLIELFQNTQDAEDILSFENHPLSSELMLDTPLKNNIFIAKITDLFKMCAELEHITVVARQICSMQSSKQIGNGYDFELGIKILNNSKLQSELQLVACCTKTFTSTASETEWLQSVMDAATTNWNQVYRYGIPIRNAPLLTLIVRFGTHATTVTYNSKNSRLVYVNTISKVWKENNDSMEFTNNGSLIAIADSANMENFVHFVMDDLLNSNVRDDHEGIQISVVPVIGPRNKAKYERQVNRPIEKEFQKIFACFDDSE